MSDHEEWCPVSAGGVVPPPCECRGGSALFTVDEAAAKLRCSPRKVFDLLADGTLTRGPKYGRKTVVTAESISAACEAAHREAVAAPRKRIRRSGRAAFNEQVDEVLARFRAG